MSVSPIATTRSSSVFRLALERPLKQQDAIGQRVAVVPPPLGQRRALVEAEQGVGRLDLHLARGAPATARSRPRSRGSPSPRGTGAGCRPGRQRRGRRTRVDPRAAFALRFSSRPARFARGPPGSADRQRSRTCRSRRTGRRAASACRCGGREESACRTSGSTAPAAARAHSCCSTTTGSSDSAMPIRLATRSTCRSTGSPGTPSAWPSTTFAVLRPTPGSSTSASMLAGTCPPCRSTSAVRHADERLGFLRGRTPSSESAVRARRASPAPAPSRPGSARRGPA